MSDATRIPQIGLVTVSDRASRGEYKDRSGPAMATYLDEVLIGPREVHSRLVPDERTTLEATLRELADAVSCDLVLTSGGTGPAPRDITPDVTTEVCRRLLPGFGEAMRLASLAEVPTAVLSRQVAGVRGSCLIVNLPGSPRAIATCLDAVFAAIPDCIDQIGGARLETNSERVRAFRPH